MHWTRLLFVEARILLCDSHQTRTAFNNLTRTYCSPMMVNVKCAFEYDRLGGHDVVVGEAFLREKRCIKALFKKVLYAL